jgi:hypothetical protein
MTTDVLYWLLSILVFVLAFLVRQRMDKRPAAPVLLGVVQLRSDESMADVLSYTVTAALPVDADVVSRMLTIVVNGEDMGTVDVPVDSTELSVFSAPQDAEVTLTLVDVDDAGNKSEPAVYSFVATDTIAPAQPGGLGVTLTGESTQG